MTIRFLTLAALVAVTASAQQQQFASIGDFKLDSDDTIRGLRLGYRTFGTLNADKSNAVLFPTWFGGNTEALVGLIGPGKLIETEGLYVIAVDAIGNGVSTSPSNSTAQPRLKFPKFTIRDMVRSQHRMLTEKLGIRHLRAVVGISMGGMQTFEWAYRYPDFLDRAIPIVGTPQMTVNDALLWTAEMRIIEEDAEWNGGDYKTQPKMPALNLVHAFALSTPQRRLQETPAPEVPKFIKNSEESRKTDACDWYRQLEAMLAQAIPLEDAAKKIKAKALIIAASQDHMVNPSPALALAKLLKARTIVLDSDCGHLAPGCETKSLSPAIAAFLRQ